MYRRKEKEREAIGSMYKKKGRGRPQREELNHLRWW